MSPRERQRRPTPSQVRVLQRIAAGEAFLVALAAEVRAPGPATRVRRGLEGGGWIKDGALTERARAALQEPLPDTAPSGTAVVGDLPAGQMATPATDGAKPGRTRKLPKGRKRGIKKSIVFGDDACVVTLDDLAAQEAATQAGAILAPGTVTRVDDAAVWIDDQGGVHDVHEATIALGIQARAIHARLCAKVRAIETGFMEAAQDVAEAYQGRIWEFLGHETPETYFEGAVGLRMRTVLALKAIAEAVWRLPESERPAATQALGTIGRHKATVLVPVLGNSPTPWQDWVAKAQSLPEQALQAVVSQATGAAPRGKSAERDHGQEFLDRLISGLHPKFQRRARTVLLAYAGWLASQAGQAQPYDPRSVVLVMIDRAQQELAEAGIEITVTDE